MTQTTENNVEVLSRQVPLPIAGENYAISLENATVLALSFDPADVSFSRSGNDLVFEVDGGTVSISDFFAVGDGPLPELQFPDGTIVASADLLASYGLDISTAAGPTAAGPPLGSGLSAYDGNAGDLIGGVGAGLDAVNTSQGDFRFDAGLEDIIAFAPAAGVGGAGIVGGVGGGGGGAGIVGGGGTGGGGGGGGQAPVPPVANADNILVDINGHFGKSISSLADLKAAGVVHTVTWGAPPPAGVNSVGAINNFGALPEGKLVLHILAPAGVTLPNGANTLTFTHPTIIEGSLTAPSGTQTFNGSNLHVTGNFSFGPLPSGTSSISVDGEVYSSNNDKFANEFKEIHRDSEFTIATGTFTPIVINIDELLANDSPGAVFDPTFGVQYDASDPYNYTFDEAANTITITLKAGVTYPGIDPAFTYQVIGEEGLTAKADVTVTIGVFGTGDNDLLQFNPSAKLVDGGGGFDFLTGISSGDFGKFLDSVPASLDDLLSGGRVVNIEAIIAGAGSFKLISLADLDDVTIGSDNITFGGSWTQVAAMDIGGTDYVRYNHDGGALYILVEASKIAS